MDRATAPCFAFGPRLLSNKTLLSHLIKFVILITGILYFKASTDVELKTVKITSTFFKKSLISSP